MDVDAASFPLHLLGLFINISEADFVSFDLELSGIPSHLPNKQRRGPGRLTLQDRYAETKQGADRYQILQVGITCARFDPIANKYILRPYNINLSPLLSERLDFEREITFQSGACSFLLEHGFDLGAPFANGVQYLSREEADRAQQMAWDRIDKKNPIEDLQLKDEDVDSLDFVRRAREAITKWYSKRSVTSPDSLAITTHTGLSNQPPVSVISRFEKRLVHQLVRAEFQDCVAIGRQDCIRIVPFDAAREAENIRRLKQRVKDQIFRQTGFRWVFEALARGHIDRRNPPFIARSSAGMDGQDRFDRALERLKSTQPVLVGHNMFTDIVYLYRTFVGELPDTLEGFCDAIHELFPKIIDTKYLATHAGGDLNVSPSLEEIAKDLQHQSLPIIATDADHSKYQDTEAFHEAGYDSLLTATIMLRLAAKLGAEQKNTPKTLSDPTTKSTQRSPPPGDETPVTEETADFVRDGREKVEKPIPIPPVESTFSESTFSEPANKKKKKRSKSPKKAAKPADPATARFHTKNVFDNLRELHLNDGEPESSTESDREHAGWGDESSAPVGSWQDDVFVQDESGWVPVEQMQRKAMELIPGFDNVFWTEFGNKLRVFGTQEAVLKVADWEV